MTTQITVTPSEFAAVATFCSTRRSAGERADSPGAHSCVIRSALNPAAASRSICACATVSCEDLTLSSAAPMSMPGPPACAAGARARNAAATRIVARICPTYARPAHDAGHAATRTPLLPASESDPARNGRSRIHRVDAGDAEPVATRRRRDPQQETLRLRADRATSRSGKVLRAAVELRVVVAVERTRQRQARA